MGASQSSISPATNTPGSATLRLDLLPDFNLSRVIADVAHPRGSRSLSSHLQSRLGLKGVKAALLHELLPREVFADAAALAAAIKQLPLRVNAPRPIDEAISSAGGVRFEALDERFMLRALPGVFCAGEMLDWEAPTGGYLLTACFASGRVAGQGAAGPGSGCRRTAGCGLHCSLHRPLSERGHRRPRRHPAARAARAPRRGAQEHR